MQQDNFIAIVHTKPNCMPCRMTKRHLSKLGASFSEEAITEEKAKKFRVAGLLSAPIVEIVRVDEYGETIDDVISGFQPDALNSYFKKE